MSSGSTADVVELLRIFYTDRESSILLNPVEPDAVPAPYDRLLIHNNHMTVTVEDFYGSPVNVRVLQVESNEQYYARKILLTRQTDNAVVQFGIVRLNRQLLPTPAWEEIESQKTPLGRVLIEQEVLRQVELLKVWKVSDSSELAEHFAAPMPTYGRTARILVNHEPAVELLEIVSPCPPPR